jgi:hypothetical protein
LPGGGRKENLMLLYPAVKPMPQSEKSRGFEKVFGEFREPVNV